MTIKIVRIDDRLIHGQIVQGWLKTIDVDKILIVSDEVANDEMQQVLLSMAVPSSVKLVIKNIKDASYEIANEVYENDNLMILFSNPQDIVKMIDNGIKFQSINIGGMHYSHGKKQYPVNNNIRKIGIFFNPISGQHREKDIRQGSDNPDAGIIGFYHFVFNGGKRHILGQRRR